MMKLRLRAWDTPSSAVILPGHSAGRTTEAATVRWVPDPPQSSSCTLPAPRGGGNSQTITFTRLLPSLPGEQGCKAIAPRDQREPRAPHSSPRSPTLTFQRNQTPALDVFKNKIGCLFTQSGLIRPKAVGPAAVILGSDVLTSSRARCSPSSLLSLKPVIQAFPHFPLH